jgi:phosphoglycerate kinase
MAIKSVTETPVEGRRVFVRVDFNVPLTPAGGVADDTRIREALPTIKHLIGRGARTVLGSHLGRPKGKADPKSSLEPVGVRLAELIGQEVMLTDEPTGDGARKVVNDVRDGQVALLENLRWNPGEEANDDQFARALASYADVYCNDAFGTAHRAHASTAGMVKLVGTKCAGLLMLKEIRFLGKLLGEVERPYWAILGGAKVSDKIGVLENLLGRVDGMVIGGAMANTFLAASGANMGTSKVETEKLALARAFLQKAEKSKVQVLLPSDVVAAPNPDAARGQNVDARKVPAAEMALDIGEASARNFAANVERARTVFWNGPMGMFERTPFAAGTLAVAKAVATAGSRGATTVIGGGDSVAAIHQAGLADKITHISTGGGASLEFLEGKKLPGIAVLEE